MVQDSLHGFIGLPLTDRQSGNSNKTRYTVLCQDLIAQYRDAAKGSTGGKSPRLELIAWAIAQIHQGKSG